MTSSTIKRALRADQSARIRLDGSSSSLPDGSAIDAEPRTERPDAAVSPDLVEVLEESQRLGFIGRRAVRDVIRHARFFVDDLGVTPDDAVQVLDLGAGGGVPGLVIAHDLPKVAVTLLDRRRTRTDFLERAVRKLDWSPRVGVLVTDAAQPQSDRKETFDRVVARGFGPPSTTLAIAVRWVRPGGQILISEPPEGDRWSSVDLARVGVDRVESGASIARFVRR